MRRENAVSYVVDSDAAARCFMTRLLGSAGHEVVTFGNAREFLRHSSAGLAFGCIFLGLNRPDIDGIAICREMVARGLRHPVIAMIQPRQLDLAVHMIKAGAFDVLQTPIGEATLMRKLATALASRDERHDDGAAEQRIAALSRRQREVLAGLVAGAQNKMIALELGISPRTVEIHRANLMTKLQVRSLSEVVRLAISAGIKPADGAMRHAAEAPCDAAR